MTEFLPVVLAAHVALAVGLLLPSILLPFALRARRPATESGNAAVRALLWLQARGSVVFGVGLALTGSLLVGMIGTSLLAQPWLLVALGLYVASLVVALAIQRPELRRLVGLRAGPADEAVWRARARRQRYVSYAMAALVGTIAFLMSTKPRLW